MVVAFAASSLFLFWQHSGMLITAQVSNPPTLGPTWEERQEGIDRGLISAWQAGLSQRTAWPEAAEAASRGELPVLPFKGGVEKELKTKKKFGALHYVAMWQGLRGDDLEVLLGEQVKMKCSKTKVLVTFTDDQEVLLQAV